MKTALSLRVQHAAVVVLGGGPAGAAAALSLARLGHTVALIDSSTNAAGWKIGEGLPPEARPVLQRLELWESFTTQGHLAAHGNCSAWGSAELQTHNFLFNPYGHGWHLDRTRFDGWLRAQALAAGACDYCDASALAAQQLDTGWQLTLTGGRLITAQFVLDATGRRSWFARQQGAQRLRVAGHEKLLAVAALLTPVDANADADSLTMIEATRDGWWYTARLAAGQLVAAYLSDRDLMDLPAVHTARGWWDLLQQTQHLAARVARYGYQLTTAPRSWAADSSRLDVVAGEDWLAAGDAAAAYDPLSSYGLLAALETGAEAGAAMHARLQDEATGFQHYAHNWEERWERYLASLRFYYAQEQRWLTSPFWQRRLSL
jgi:flavin-dependent dehydrogenase